jgi:hypothetical protein
MKTTVLTTAVAAIVGSCASAASAEHITMEQLAIHELQTQNPQQFVDQFKQFTKLEFTEQVFKKMKYFAAGAAVTVDMAEINGAKPAVHDPRHCDNNGTCFEKWLYRNMPNKFGFESGAEFLKMAVSDTSYHDEATEYCHSLAGVVSCTVDVENGNSLKKFLYFSLNDASRGVVAQMYALAQ